MKFPLSFMLIAYSLGQWSYCLDHRHLRAFVRTNINKMHAKSSFSKYGDKPQVLSSH